MNREYFKNKEEFEKHKEYTTDFYEEEFGGDLSRNIDFFFDECEPDEYPCILIWTFDEDGHVDHEYIYEKDFTNPRKRVNLG